MFIKKCLLFIVSSIAAQGIDDVNNGVSTGIEDNPLRVIDDNGVNVTVVDDSKNFTIVDDSLNVTDDNSHFEDHTNNSHLINDGSVNVIMNKMMILSLLTLFV